MAARHPEASQMSDSEKPLLNSLLLAAAALAGSGLLLLLASFVYAKLQVPDGANVSHTKTIPGRELVARMGEASADGAALIITRPKTYQKEQHALVSTRTRFTADSYPFLSYSLEGLHTGQSVNLIWRTARNPAQLFRTRLPHNRGRVSTFNLSSAANWHGTITEIGVHVNGELRDEPIRIPALNLEPYSWRGLLAVFWSEWNSFRGWSARSINFIKGTPGSVGTGTLSPVLAMAVWAGVALLILQLLNRTRGGYPPVSYGVVVFVPCIALDLLWQKELGTQLQETRHLFGGKNTHERHMADYDRDLYAYATRLKLEALPAAPGRIFLLHDSDGLNFERLKTQYYLLPHNVYNYGRYPVRTTARPGDYILSLGTIPDLTHDEEGQLLNWGANMSMPVEVVDSDGSRMLFRVLPDSDKTPVVSGPGSDG